jgi:hypothetical protein
MSIARTRKFVESLDPNRMYKVTNNKNYNYVFPKNMTDADVSELMERDTLKKGSILNESISGNVILD